MRGVGGGSEEIDEFVESKADEAGLCEYVESEKGIPRLPQRLGEDRQSERRRPMSDTTTELSGCVRTWKCLSGTPSGNRHFITSAIESRGNRPAGGRGGHVAGGEDHFQRQRIKKRSANAAVVG